MEPLPKTLKKQIADLMHVNRRIGKGYQFTVPSPNSYPYQWLWDSCFHAIILSHFEIGAAKAELRTLASRQFKNGMIPHMIYWEKATSTSFPHISWGKRGTSSITQPPMLAYAAWQIYQKDKDETFLKELYPAMRNFYAFFFKERDPRHHNLIGIINPDESGEDNSPRFDKALGLPSQHSIDINYKKRLALIERNRVCNFSTDCMENFYWSRDVSFNSILVRNLRNMADIAVAIGQNDDAIGYDMQAEAVTRAMREYMFSIDGVMYSTYGLNYRKVKVLTWAIFMPLFAGILTPDEADQLVKEHLLNKNEFATKFSIPTVSASEPSFDPSGFWRGPVWTSANWFIYHGLKNYGFDKEALRLRAQSLKLVEKSGMREYYDPFSGEGYGAKEFTWSALLIDME